MEEAAANFKAVSAAQAQKVFGNGRNYSLLLKFLNQIQIFDSEFFGSLKFFYFYSLLYVCNYCILNVEIAQCRSNCFTQQCCARAPPASQIKQYSTHSKAIFSTSGGGDASALTTPQRRSPHGHVLSHSIPGSTGSMHQSRAINTF